MVRVVALQRRMGLDVAHRFRILGRRTGWRLGVQREVRVSFDIAHRVRVAGNVAQKTSRLGYDTLVVLWVVSVVLK